MTSPPRQPRPLGILHTALILLLLSLLAPPQTAGVEDADWRSILQRNQEAIALGERNLQAFEVELKDVHLQRYRKGLLKIQKERGQIILWYGMDYDPVDLRDAVRGIKSLQWETQELLDPLDKRMEVLSLLLNKLTEIEEEIAAQLSDPSASAYAKTLKESAASLERLRVRTERIRADLAAEMQTGRLFLDRLGKTQVSLNDKILLYWSEYFFRRLPTLFSSEIWTHLPQRIEEARIYYASCIDMLRGRDAAESLRLFVFKFLAYNAAAMLPLLLLLRWRLARRLSDKVVRRSYLAVCLLSSGTTLFLVASDAPFVLYPILYDLSEVCVAAGLVLLSEAFHHTTAREGLPWGHRRVIWWLFALLVTSSFLQMVKFPYVFECAIWTGMVVPLGWKLMRVARGSAQINARVLIGCCSLILLCLAVLAVFGFLVVAVVLGSVLFFGVLTVTIGVGVFRLIAMLESQARERGTSPILYSLFEGVAFPLFAICLLSLNLWLCFSQFGESDPFFRVISWEATWGSTSVSLLKLIIIFIGFFLTKSLVYVTESVLKRMRDSKANLDHGMVESLRTISRYLWWGLFVLGVMAFLKFSFASMVFVAGGLSIGIGFGLQHIVNNFMSGLILLFGRSVQPGDVIQLGQTVGTVRRVTMRNTVVQTSENATIFVPNSELISQQLINWSHKDRSVRREISVGVAYGSDVEKVRGLLLRVAQSHPEVLSSPAPHALFWEFGENSLKFRLRFWIGNVDKDVFVMSDIRSEVDRLFREHGIEIALPQQDIHLRTAPALGGLLPSGLGSAELQERHGPRLTRFQSRLLFRLLRWRP